MNELKDGNIVGAFTANGQSYELQIRLINNKWYLVQMISNFPDKFTVRPKGFLTAAGVTLNSNYTDALAVEVSTAAGSGATYSTPDGFVTPAGYTSGTLNDGTPFIEKVADSIEQATTTVVTTRSADTLFAKVGDFVKTRPIESVLIVIVIVIILKPILFPIPMGRGRKKPSGLAGLLSF
jgi:hypothetical protein